VFLDLFILYSFDSKLGIIPLESINWQLSIKDKVRSLWGKGWIYIESTWFSTVAVIQYNE
jgi:hypothetical protein